MAAATLLLRWAGYWILGRFAIGPRMRRALEALPGSLFVALTLPLALRAGPAGLFGACVAALLMVWSGREFVALAGGLAAVVLARALALA